jgi:Flp pilus assembly protein TadG
MYALALVGLIAIAGVGFDYGRLAAAQSELQNAADHAALAAATQLDGKADAMVRAETAARAAFATSTSPYVNETRIANDGKNRPITTVEFSFYTDPDSNELNKGGDGALAKVVRAKVSGRSVFFALTPVVAAMNSGNITAYAMARLDKAVCNLPPIMLCLGKNGVLPPVGPGMALKLRYGALAPGAFGFLNPRGFDVNGEMGLNKTTNDCQALPDVEVRTGTLGAQADAMATRFDYYNKYNKIPCDSSTGDYCPAQGVRKNFAIPVNLQTTVSITSPKYRLTFAETQQALASQGVTPACPASFTGKRPDWSDFADIPLVDPSAASFGLDTCFTNGTCSYVGDGDWSADKARYFSRYLPGLDPNSFATRYDVYKQELSAPATYLKQRDVVGLNVAWGGSPTGGLYTHRVNGFYCAYPQPLFATPVVPTPPQSDRRVIPVAIVDNCDQLQGTSTPPHIAAYLDVFLLEPPVHSTSDFHAEVIGPALRPETQSGYQYYAHNKAVLIR